MLFRFLDNPHVQVDNRREMLPSTKPVALLVYLACQQTWVTRDTLSALFAEDNTDADALRQLRVILSRARKFGWAGALELEDNRLRFMVKTDLQLLRQAIGQSDWQAATELYKSEFLSGFEIQAAGFEAWLEVERETLRQAWLEAALLYARSLAAQHDHLAASKLLQNILALDALSEDVLALYLEQQYLAGGRSEALKTFERFREQLRSELGLDPLESTLKLVQTIRQAAPLESTSVVSVGKSSVPLTVLRPPQLIGRDLECATLETASQRVMLVSGEPGSGKTRLLEEVLGRTRWLACFEGLENVAYQPLIAFLRSQLSTLPDLGVYAQDLARLIPEVLPNANPHTDDPISAKARLLEALARCFEAQAKPIVIDDLQWADPSSLELLSFLALRGAVKIFGTYRSSEISPALGKTVAAWRSNGVLLEVKLEPLTLEGVNSLLASLSGLEAGAERFSAWLSKQSGGNPFFALETLRALFETGMLQENAGQWTSQLDDLSLDYSELRVPSKVAAVIEQRISRLSEPAKRALQAACVMRQGFTPKTLAGIVGLSEFAVLDALEEAQNSSLIAGDHFVHDLIRQGMYQNLPETRRKVLHGNVAAMLENVAEPMVVAEHWFEAGETQAAVIRWCSLAKIQSELGMDDTALLLNERALQYNLDDRLSDSIRIGIAINHASLGHSEHALKLLEGIEDSSNDPQLCSSALIQMAAIHSLDGRLSEAKKVLEKISDLLPFKLLSSENQQEFLREQQRLATRQGRFQEALEFAQRRLGWYDLEKPSVHVASLHSDIGAILINLNRREESLASLQKAFEMQKTIRSRDGQVQAAANLLYFWITVGQPELGLEIAEQALKLDPKHVLTRTEALRNNLANAYARLEQNEKAIGHYAIVAADSKNPVWQAAAWATLARLYHRVGRNDEISDAIDRAIHSIAGVEYDPPRVLVLTIALNHGSDIQLQNAQAAIGQVNLEVISPFLRDQLLQAQVNRQARTPT